MSDQTPTLSYADFAARRGIVVEPLENGLRITIPPLASMPDVSDQPSAFGAFGRAVRQFFRASRPSTAHYAWRKVIVELTADEFSVTETEVTLFGGKTSSSQRFAWPRREIAELRTNRYSNGIYVRIPGKVNTDVLAQMDPEIVRWLGDKLDRALHPNNNSTELRESGRV